MYASVDLQIGVVQLAEQTLEFAGHIAQNTLGFAG
jgi:hypothetical protein